jgi:hypothetical protein
LVFEPANVDITASNSHGYRRKSGRFAVVIIDAEDEVLASSEELTGRFAVLQPNTRTLAPEISAAARDLPEGQIAVILGETSMRVVQLKGRMSGLRALIFEPLKLREGE